MKVDMPQQNNKAFGSVSNRLDSAHLLKYGIHNTLQEAIPALKDLTKKHGIHLDMFEYRDTELKFNIFRGRLPYLKYLTSRVNEFFQPKRCGGYCNPGKAYFEISKPQEIVEAAENAIEGKNNYLSSGIEGL